MIITTPSDNQSETKRQLGNKKPRKGANNGAILGFEEKLWRAAEGLRGHIEPAEYKHIILSFVFLEYALKKSNKLRESKWSQILSSSDKEIYATIDSLISMVEMENPDLKDLLKFDVRRIGPDRLRDLLLSLDEIDFTSTHDDSRDLLGRVYEYFLAKFASSEGRSGGEYYTPRSVVQLLVEILKPYKGIIYDPCCGTAGMFVQSEEFLRAQGKNTSEISVVGQESSPTTWKLAKMNLVLRNIKNDLGPRNGDTFREDLHKKVKADFILANPPFNAKNWGGEKLQSDSRWMFGAPPSANANFAWIQHIYSHLKPEGVAGFVLSNGSLTSDQGGEGNLRQTLVQEDVVECIVTLPNQLFYGTQIPACLWILSPKKTRDKGEHLYGQTLLIDARKMGHLVDRVHAELGAEEIAKIASTYHEWRTNKKFQAVPGFAKAVGVDEIGAHKFALFPGRYVGFSRTESAGHDLEKIREEFREVKERVSEVIRTSKNFVSVLEEVMNG